MTKRTAEVLSIPLFGLVLALALLVAMPIKTSVKNSAEVLGPLAASAGMLASFMVFLLIFFIFAAPAAILWNRHQEKTVTGP